MMIPKNERQVDGLSILDNFTGALICSQREIMVIMLSKCSFESGNPAVKKLSKYNKGGNTYDTCAKESGGWPWIANCKERSGIKTKR